MKETLVSRHHWQGQGFDWTESYSLRQFVDAASYRRRATLSFQNAVEGIVLCETIAKDICDRGLFPGSGKSVYGHMRIEPAASYINGLTSDLLDNLLRDDGLAQHLLKYTGQVHLEVFFDMANGRTVTHKLAERTYRFLKSRVGSSLIDPPYFRYDRRRRSYKPSEYERVDVEESMLLPIV